MNGSDRPLESVETLSREALDSLQRRKLEELLRLAKVRSPFYRDHLADVQVDGPWAMADLPVLTKDHLVQHSPPESQDLLTGPLAAAYVFRSGGTTGSPKFSPFSVEEFRRFSAMFLRTYGAAGLRSTDRVGNLFVAGSLYASFIFVNRALEEMGVVNFPFTGLAPIDVVARNLELFPINTLMGIPSWVLQVVQMLPAATLPKIEKIFYAGEHLYAEERHYLQERLPNLSVLASGGYGAVDTGLMGYQCPHSQGAVHHELADHVNLEIVDPSTMRPVEGEQEGIVLVTTLDRFLMPLIRYVIGDAARWIEAPCPCGRTSRRFELLGRLDDLRIGISSVGYDEVMKAVAEFEGLTSNLQLVKERESRKDRMTVKIEVRPEFKGDRLALAHDLKAAVLRHKPDLAKLIGNGHVHDLLVMLYDLGEIPRVPVTGKVRRTVDHTLS